MNSYQLRRRRFQFSLRTLFVLVVIVSIPLAWIGYSLSWIRQRREYEYPLKWLPQILGKRVIQGSKDITRPPQKPPAPDAPAGLWLFGEEGVREVHCSRQDVELVKRLFPEATIIVEPTWEEVPGS